MTDVVRCGRVEARVIYLDNHLLVVEKPVNVPVQRDASGDMDLLSACKAYIGEKFSKPGAVYLGLVHRLDRPVGGVMVFARTSKAAARLSKAFSAHEVDKRYLAVARVTLSNGEGERAPIGMFSSNNGDPDAPRAVPAEDMSSMPGGFTLRDHLLKDERTGMVRVVPPGTPGAKEAVLDSRVVDSRDGLTLLEIRLRTGRPHQIRVQHAARGLYLWGDARYGGGQPGEQIALWAYRLTIEHPTLKTMETFCAPPPPKPPWNLFQEAMDHVR